MYSEELFAFCSGQCQASRFPPASCRCICGGRNHGILRQSRQPFNVTPQYQNPYESFNREIPQLPEERLQLTARNIAKELDALPLLGNRVSHAPAMRDGESQTNRDNSGLTRPKNGKYRIAKAIGRGLKHSISGYSQDELNRKIRDGLRQQFNEDNTDLAIFQAFQIRQSKQPDANRPELYELYETGEIDEALTMMGKSWHIGRPKR